MQGYKVYFTTIHGLLTQLRESHSQRTLRQMETRFEKYDLVVCDEFGYISFDKQGAELLFSHLSLRAGGFLILGLYNYDYNQVINPALLIEQWQFGYCRI